MQIQKEVKGHLSKLLTPRFKPSVHINWSVYILYSAFKVAIVLSLSFLIFLHSAMSMEIHRSVRLGEN